VSACAGRAAVVADLVVAEHAVVAADLATGVPSSVPWRWRCWSPIAAVAMSVAAKHVDAGRARGRGAQRAAVVPSSAAGGRGGPSTSPARLARRCSPNSPPACPARPGAPGWWRCGGDVAQALGQLGEGGSNLDPLGGAGAAVALAGSQARCSRSCRSTAALVPDVAQALLREHCG